jgi:hypothetical protein
MERNVCGILVGDAVCVPGSGESFRGQVALSWCLQSTPLSGVRTFAARRHETTTPLSQGFLIRERAANSATGMSYEVRERERRNRNGN